MLSQLFTWIEKHRERHANSIESLEHMLVIVRKTRERLESTSLIGLFPNPCEPRCNLVAQLTPLGMSTIDQEISCLESLIASGQGTQDDFRQACLLLTAMPSLDADQEGDDDYAWLLFKTLGQTPIWALAEGVNSAAKAYRFRPQPDEVSMRLPGEYRALMNHLSLLKLAKKHIALAAQREDQRRVYREARWSEFLPNRTPQNQSSQETERV